MRIVRRQPSAAILLFTLIPSAGCAKAPTYTRDGGLEGRAPLGIDPTHPNQPLSPTGDDQHIEGRARTPVDMMVTADRDHACALDPKGAVWCWGRWRGGDGHAVSRIEGLGAVVEVRSGGGTTCARHHDGRVSCWGSGFEGKLGNGASGDSETPVSVRSLHDAEQISVGASFACVLRTGGEVGCWGESRSGQLGDAVYADAIAPWRATWVEIPGLAHASQVEAGDMHGCAILGPKPGSVVCWGHNGYEQAGQLRVQHVTTPTPVQGLTDVTQLAVGDRHSCAVRQSGSIACWGSYEPYLISEGIYGKTSAIPVAIDGLEDIVEVAVGSRFTCARDRVGQVYCWGVNTDGVCGQEAVPYTPRPSLVRSTTGPLTDATSLSAGESFACVVRRSGEVACWGNGDKGQLGPAAPSPSGRLGSRSHVATTVLRLVP